MNKRVVIVQPYVPTYRVAFFENLRHCLASYDIDCVVAAGVARGDQAARGDSTQPDWLVPVKHVSWSIGKRSLDLSISPRPWKHTDAVILGLEGTSMPVYQALLLRLGSGVKVGLWGHVRPYVSKGHPVDLALEKWQMRRADHVFAYTRGGRDYALKAGVASNKVTAVENSIDTSTLESSKANLTQDKVQVFAKSLGINQDKTICYIGGLDSSKRIRLLAEVLDKLWRRDRSIRLLVGGNGPQKSLLTPAFERGQAVDLGYLNDDGKALVMAASRAIAMPGRIGLVAVDSLVMQCPIVTTDWPYHAPEAEYLTEGSTRFTSKNDSCSYVDLILRVLEKQPNTDTNAHWAVPSLEGMVENFAIGVRTLLEVPHQPQHRLSANARADSSRANRAT